MEWFGLTYYGYPDPIKEVMRPDYKEPEVQLGLFELIAKGTKKSFSELASQLDCCIGRADGYIYKSYDRLIRMRRKGIFKPVGPTEMYKYPATEAMKAGFWRDDPALKNEDWFKQRVYEPKPSTDVTKYVDEAKKVDKFFTL